MENAVLKFNVSDRPEFFKVLRKRVNGHFKENGITKNANTAMKVKTVAMLSIYFVPYALFITGVVNTTPLYFLMWIIMGFGMSGIGLSVMHDANHGSYSKNQTVNKILGYCLNIVGGDALNWRIQHNVLHHTYTNVSGMDEDIDTNKIMRFSPNQPQLKMHKFQAFYAWFFYGLMTIFWVLWKDYAQLFRYEKMGLLKAQNTTPGKAMMTVVVSKVIYLAYCLVLPMMISGFPWWITLLGFLAMHFTSGLILALIFQPAHVLLETDFPIENNEGTLENSWAIHQLKTTANFANGSRWFSWYCGGLNYQIEHHLFPSICHIHYRDISKIVEETAKEYGIPYYHQPTFYHALKSHFTHLHMLGKLETAAA